MASFLDYSVCNPSVEVDLFVLGYSPEGKLGTYKLSSLLRLDGADSWEKLHDLRILSSYTSI